ncbi:MAG: hypothetical protein DRH08_01360 [Deltaproteobacteria bacterium]|nr:MAG: hypothetical protein DRH08_01360 [Deltaproteobacteria bacterium]
MAAPGENNGYDDGPVTTQPPVENPLVEPPPSDSRPTTGPDYVPDENLDQYGYQTGINGKENYNINVGMTGGLMDTIGAIGDSKYADRNYDVNATRANATNRQVGQNELSQYQLQQMLASNSPLMQQAAAQGLARGGARGLMNSSLATGAAQGAMISGAQPFALQDANTYGKTASENMAATNEASRLNAELGTRAGIAGMEAGARRDQQVLAEQLSGYGDIRKAMIGIEDREDTQANTAWQNQLNRDWTSEENMLTNSLSWAQSQLDSATKYGVTREQAFAEMYSSIMTNNNPKFTASQREQAVRNLDATMKDYYNDDGTFVNPPNYDPKTGNTLPPEVTPAQAAVGDADNNYAPPWWPSDLAWAGYPEYNGSSGGDAGVEQNYNPEDPSASDPSVQQYGSPQSPEIGRESASLPGVA